MAGPPIPIDVEPKKAGPHAAVRPVPMPKENIMRVNGRLLRPSTLAERRVLKSLGIDCLRVPRGHNPFAIARQIARLARGAVPEARIIKEILEEDRVRRPKLPLPLPNPQQPASPWCPHAAC